MKIKSKSKSRTGKKQEAPVEESFDEDQEIIVLQRRQQEEAPASGSQQARYISLTIPHLLTS